MNRSLVTLFVALALVAAPASALAAPPETGGFEITVRDRGIEATCGDALGVDQVWVRFSLSISVQDNTEGNELDRTQRTRLEREIFDQDGNFLGLDRQNYTETLTGKLDDASTWLEVRTGTVYNMRTVGSSVRWTGVLATDASGLLWFRGPTDPSTLVNSTFAEVFCAAATA